MGKVNTLNKYQSQKLKRAMKRAAVISAKTLIKAYKKKRRRN